MSERKEFEEQKKEKEKKLKEIRKDAKTTNIIPDDARKEGIERRIRKWHWRYSHYSNDRTIIKLRLRLEKEYTNYKKSDEFKSYPRTLEEYIMDFFEVIAEAHYKGSAVVHIDGKISAEEEFPIIEFFGDTYWD